MSDHSCNYKTRVELTFWMERKGNMSDCGRECKPGQRQHTGWRLGGRKTCQIAATYNDSREGIPNEVKRDIRSRLLLLDDI